MTFFSPIAIVPLPADSPILPVDETACQVSGPREADSVTLATFLCRPKSITVGLTTSVPVVVAGVGDFFPASRRPACGTVPRGQAGPVDGGRCACAGGRRFGASGVFDGCGPF